MKNTLRSFISFTRVERVGIMFLLGAVVVLVAIRISMSFWVRPATSVDQQKISKAWEEYKQNEAKEEAAAVNTTSAVIDLNTADSATLMTIKGIGPANAGRIIAYRNTYGHFTDIEQIKAICTMPDSTFMLLKQHVTINTGS